MPNFKYPQTRVYDILKTVHTQISYFVLTGLSHWNVRVGLLSKSPSNLKHNLYPEISISDVLNNAHNKYLTLFLLDFYTGMFGLDHSQSCHQNLNTTDCLLMSSLISQLQGLKIYWVAHLFKENQKRNNVGYLWM